MEIARCSSEKVWLPEGSVELFAGKVATRGLYVFAQVESPCYLLGGLAAQRACYGVLWFITQGVGGHRLQGCGV